MKIDRRTLLRQALATSAAAFAAADTDAAALPAPQTCGIDHIVVVTMENRSFDHLLGWVWTADGRQRGLVYPDRLGTSRETHRLAPDFKGCGHPDPSHTWEGGRTQYNGGRMDGFLLSEPNDVYAIGYYGMFDRPFCSGLAANYTTADRYFCSILGPTFPNRIFQHAAQTDRIDNSAFLSTLPTIWDRLRDAGVSRRYYFSNLPFLALWGLAHLSIAATFDQFLADAAAGTLPAVSFVEPRFTLGDGVFSNDDHPHADVRAGDAFLSQVFHALAGGPGWPGTVLVVTYDEWGGFFDHVPPPRVVAPNAVDPDLVGGRALLGFRVPVVVASPFTRGFPFVPRVSHTRFDHTSVLKLIEWRWGLPPLTARDASFDVGNLASVLRFGSPDFTVPRLPRPLPPLPRSCGAASVASRERTEPGAWEALRSSGLLDGWPAVSEVEGLP